MLSTQSLDARSFASTIRVLGWPEVDTSLDEVFARGGAVRLWTEFEIDTPRAGFVRRDAIEMLALPGRFRLVVTPFNSPGERTKQREWWRPGDDVFRGTEHFGDEECDIRTICNDISVAKELFAEFVAERRVTQRLMESTISVWTPKPRT